MSDEQQDKPANPEGRSGETSASDRPASASPTLGGLAELVKATQAQNGGPANGPVSLGGLAELVKAEPKSESPAPKPAPASPFDQKVGAAASQYTFVMNSSDLQDIIGDANKQRVAVHSAASAGFDAAPRAAHSEPPPRPATADISPPPRTRDLPSRAPSRGPMVNTKPDRSSTTPILLAVAVVLLLVFLLLQRNAALEPSLETRSAPAIEATDTPDPTEAP